METSQDRISAALETRRRELEAELARLTEPPAAGANLSFGKRIGDGTAEAVERINTTAAARSIAAALTDVERALAKLREDTYGRCDACGRQIAEDRLAALPATPLCMRCAMQRSR